MSEYRVLITGSREWRNPDAMRDALVAARREANGIPMVLICGGARGADSMAADFGDQAYDCRVELHEADWNAKGKAAGFIRNQEMVDSGADLCLAFFSVEAENRGTMDCVKRAVKAGIEVWSFWA